MIKRPKSKVKKAPRRAAAVSSTKTPNTVINIYNNSNKGSERQAPEKIIPIGQLPQTDPEIFKIPPQRPSIKRQNNIIGKHRRPFLPPNSNRISSFGSQGSNAQPTLPPSTSSNSNPSFTDLVLTHGKRNLARMATNPSTIKAVGNAVMSRVSPESIANNIARKFGEVLETGVISQIPGSSQMGKLIKDQFQAPGFIESIAQMISPQETLLQRINPF